MKTAILILLPAILFIFAIYLFFNMALAAWLIRSARTRMANLLDYFKDFWIRQYDSIPSATMSTTFVLHAVSVAIIVWTVRTPTDIFALPMILIGSTFLVSASILGFVARMPFFQALWKSAFAKIVLLALPISLHFVAKALASERLSSLLEVSASNVPITHVVCTFLLLLLLSGVLLGLVAVIFEVMFILSLGIDHFKQLVSGKSSRDRPKNIALLMLSSKAVMRATDRLRIERVVRRTIITAVLFSSSVACLVSLEAIVRFQGGNLERVVLHAMVFELDAIPAKYCRLSAEDRKSALLENPEVKVLPSSSSQEKAFVLRRGATLLEPVTFVNLLSSLPDEKSLRVGEVVDCLVVRDDAGAEPRAGAR